MDEKQEAQINFQQQISELLNNEELTRSIADHKTAKTVLFGAARKGMLNRVGLQWNPTVGLRIVMDAFVEREEEPKDGVAWALLLMSLGFNVVDVEGDLVWYEPRLSKQLPLDMGEQGEDKVMVSALQLPAGADVIYAEEAENLIEKLGAKAEAEILSEQAGADAEAEAEELEAHLIHEQEDNNWDNR